MNEMSGPLQLLQEFEFELVASRPLEATPKLLRLLARLLLLNDPEGPFPVAERQKIYTRIAAAFARLVTDHGFSPNEEQIREFCVYKVVLHNVFAASDYRDASHLQKLLGHSAPDGTLWFDDKALIKLALFSSLDDLPAQIFTQILELPSTALLPLLLGWMRQRAVLTPLGESNRSRLLESGYLIEHETLHDDLLALFVSAWMYCSYASHPNKHALKRSLNILIRGWMEGRGVGAACTPRSIKEHPRLIIIGESLRAGHAMFRCYAEKFRQLRDNFKLILVAPSTDQDSITRGCFDDWVEVSRSPDDLGETVAKIEALSPDMIYFPSVGMGFLSIALANLRLAPIQLMTVGHPATSMSDCIDYVLLSDSIKDSAASFNEVAVIRPGRGHYEPHPALPITMPPYKDSINGPLHVAVNGIAMKLSHRLIAICERLQQASARPLTFHFFPAERGVRHDGIRAWLTHRFPDSIVHPYLPYPAYLEVLARCDLMLAPFPFGNTNCTIDANVLGLPMVAHVGIEPHSLTDRGIMQRLELPAWLAADNDEDYYLAALRLISDNNERAALARHLQGINVRKRLFSLSEEEEMGTFSATARWIYDNHERILVSGKRVWQGHELDSQP